VFLNKKVPVAVLAHTITKSIAFKKDEPHSRDCDSRGVTAAAYYSGCGGLFGSQPTPVRQCKQPSRVAESHAVHRQMCSLVGDSMGLCAHDHVFGLEAVSRPNNAVLILVSGLWSCF